MPADVFKVIQVCLFFTNNGFKKLGADNVVVIPAFLKKLVVHLNGVIFQVGIVRINIQDSLFFYK